MSNSDLEQLTQAQLQEEVVRLRGLLNGDPEVIRQQFEKGKGVLADVEHWAVRVIAYSLAKSLKDVGAKNYYSLEVICEDGEPLVVTIRRKNGFDPAEVAALFRGVLTRIANGEANHHDAREILDLVTGCHVAPENAESTGDGS